MSDSKSSLGWEVRGGEESSETLPRFAAETPEPTGIGRGWLSGIVSCVLGIGGLGAVLCLRFPSLLTMPELSETYQQYLPYLRGAVHLSLVAAFLLGTLSVCLRANKTMGVIGITTTLVAALLGGSGAVGITEGEAYLSLDWFVLNLIAYSAVCIPLERLFAKYPEQPTFRKEWGVDMTYFFVNTLLIQVTSFLTLFPALVFLAWARLPSVEGWISGLPLVVQVPLCLVAADFAQYWIHRAFHAHPWLWRFHAIHHSAESMDWLAGSRLHLVDAIVTRALTYVPIYILGFSQTTIVFYVVIVSVQATFIHANVRWEFAKLQRFIATPLFHHWHHAADSEAADKNFSVHSTLWDWVFGTYHMPGRWPDRYGLYEEGGVPQGWLPQLLYPLTGGRGEETGEEEIAK